MGNKKLDEKIRKETGLDEGGAYWYKKFVESSNLVDKIVMVGEIQYEIRRLISIKDKVKFDLVEDNEIIEAYNFIVNNFKRRGLIEEYLHENGIKYPKIIGYNFYDDEEFYFKIRKKGEINWSGRLSRRGISMEKIIREINFGYEFENKELEQTVLN